MFLMRKEKCEFAHIHITYFECRTSILLLDFTGSYVILIMAFECMQPMCSLIVYKILSCFTNFKE